MPRQLDEFFASDSPDLQAQRGVALAKVYLAQVLSDQAEGLGAPAPAESTSVQARVRGHCFQDEEEGRVSALNWSRLSSPPTRKSEKTRMQANRPSLQLGQ